MALVLRGARLIDGTGSEPRLDCAVVIEDDRIQSIAEAGSRFDDADVMDLDGLTILLGLIDPHTHLGASIEFSKLAEAGAVSVAELAAGIFHNCELVWWNLLSRHWGGAL